MPVSPAMAEDLAREVGLLYQDAEAALLELLAAALEADIESPRWAELKLASLGNLRTAVEQVADALQQDTTGAVRRALVTAYNRGRQAAVAELGALDIGRELVARGTLPNAPAVDRLAASMAEDTRPLYQRITRAVVDTYRRVIGRASGTQLLTGITRRQASQRALDEFAQRGVTGFVDSANRSWDMASYAEMAVRSVTARAAIEGHIDALAEIRVGLVIVSDAPLECPLCRPWEGEILTLGSTPGPHTVRLPNEGDHGRTSVAVHVAGSLAEARGAGLFHPNCFPGDTLVTAPSGVRAADARWYEGDLVVIHTAGGKELSVTPNHPVLTPEGCVAAGALKVGSRVLRYGGSVEWVDGVGPGDEQVPARISDVFDTLRKSVPVASVHVPGAAEQFHGDGFESDVEVVLADGLLADGLNSEAVEVLGDGSFLVGGMGFSALLPEGAAGEVVGGAGHPAYSVMCRRHLRGALLGGLVGPLPELGLGAGDVGASLEDPAADGRLADAEGGRDLVLSLSGAVAVDDVVDLRRREFAGHVYNLQTGDGWYVAGGLVVHNCRHSLGAYLPGVTTRPPHHPTPGTTYEDTQRQREIERHIRRWKRVQAAAMNEDARRRAGTFVRKWQAEARAHVAAHEDLRRKPAREQISSAR
ncbi:phage minor capsid protein [Streptomyces sp. P9(2023)]|uniref:phage minor capsid protein n=1 Tax=Streptomyces sp. P9(2023) TaxID=3064394 RepID=UPI0028F3F6E2|nr:phage minor capsid protein [Streptomyces sp. P9(2023)]MDT9688188.1 phage minor capsid protein [Streptomyces sp. P9(2023)]